MEASKSISKFLPLALLLLLGCKDNHNTGDSPKRLTYKLARLGENMFTIQIPVNYKIRESSGPDFVVYYLSPTDSLNGNIGTGGLYIGGYPSLFGKANSDNSVDSLKSTLLKTISTWTVFKTNEGFLTETTKGYGDNLKIHAFATARNRSDIDTLIHIFATLNDD